MTITADAKTLWVDSYNAIESELTSGGDFASIRDAASNAGAGGVVADAAETEDDRALVLTQHAQRTREQHQREHDECCEAEG